MKILKKADSSQWKHKFTCGNCTSELEAESNDVVYNYYPGDGREPSYETYSVVCAVCSQSHSLKTSDLPKILQLEAKKRGKPSGSSFYDR